MIMILLTLMTKSDKKGYQSKSSSTFIVCFVFDKLIIRIITVLLCITGVLPPYYLHLLVLECEPQSENRKKQK